MSTELLALTLAAASLAVTHTLLGPDHYLPFIAMARARQWTTLRTVVITILCGLGHVAGSVLLALVGVVFVIASDEVTGVQTFRGNLAGWAMVAFGFAYLVWGLRRVLKNKPHTHGHSHGASLPHAHEHTHTKRHTHVHDAGKSPRDITPWVLFTLFIFGPCEPLIPLLMYPTVKVSLLGLSLVTAAFALVTILTMLSVVLISLRGLSFISVPKSLTRYSHAVAGATILLCGLAIQFGGL